MSKRLSGGFLALIYFMSNAAFAHAAESAFWGERRRAVTRAKEGIAAGPAPTQLARLPAAPDALMPLASPAAFTGAAASLAAKTPPSLPAWLPPLVQPYGAVIDVHVAARRDAPFIVHLQDAHGLMDAQKNIGAMLAALDAGRPLDVVAVEGAAGPLLLDAYRDFPTRDGAAAIADFLLAEGYIGGPEHAGLTATRALPFWGVEDKVLYRENIQAFKAALPRVDELKGVLAVAERNLSAEKARVYSPAMKEFDARQSANRLGGESAGVYVRFLAGTVPAKTRAAHKDAALFLEALRREDALDFKAVENERRRLAQALARALPADRLNVLVEKSLAQKAGRMSPGGFLRFLENFCGAAGLSLKNFPHTRAYASYVLLAEEIDRRGLLADIAGLEAAARRALALSPEEQRLAARTDDLSLLSKLSAHAMTPDDWDLYASRREAIARDFALAPALLAPFEDFCRLALRRNAAMTEALAKRLAGTGPRTAAFVAGGFHTAGLTELWKERGYSYAVVTPRIDTIPEENNALDVFARGPAPLEKLLAGEKIYLAAELPYGEAADLSVSRNDGARRLGEVLALAHVVAVETQKKAAPADVERALDAAALRASALPGAVPIAADARLAEGRAPAVEAVVGPEGREAYVTVSLVRPEDTALPDPADRGAPVLRRKPFADYLISLHAGDKPVMKTLASVPADAGRAARRAWTAVDAFMRGGLRDEPRPMNALQSTHERLAAKGKERGRFENFLYHLTHPFQGMPLLETFALVVAVILSPFLIANLWIAVILIAAIFSLIHDDLRARETYAGLSWWRAAALGFWIFTQRFLGGLILVAPIIGIDPVLGGLLSWALHMGWNLGVHFRLPVFRHLRLRLLYALALARGALPVSEAEPDPYARDVEKKAVWLRNLQLKKTVIGKDSSEFTALYAEAEETVGRILAAAGLNPAAHRLFLIEDDSVNAFVIRYHDAVFVNTGLLRDLVKEGDPLDVLAFVVAHEVVHLLQSREDVDAGRAEDESDVFHEGVEKYANEHDADMRALALMDKAGFSVKHAPTLFRRLAAQGGDHMGWTHPALSERVRALDLATTEPYWRNYFEPAKEFSAAAKAESGLDSRRRNLQKNILAATTVTDLVDRLAESQTLEEAEAVLVVGAAVLRGRGEDLRSPPRVLTEAFEKRLRELAGPSLAREVFYQLVQMNVYRALEWPMGALGARVVEYAADFQERVAETHRFRPQSLSQIIGRLGSDPALLVELLEVETPGVMEGWGANQWAAAAYADYKRDFYGLEKALSQPSRRASLDIRDYISQKFERVVGLHLSVADVALDLLLQTDPAFKQMSDALEAVRNLYLALRERGEMTFKDQEDLAEMQARLMEKMAEKIDDENDAGAVSQILSRLSMAYTIGSVSQPAERLLTVLHEKAKRDPAIRQAILDRLAKEKSKAFGNAVGALALANYPDTPLIARGSALDEFRQVVALFRSDEHNWVPVLLANAGLSPERALREFFEPLAAESPEPQIYTIWDSWDQKRFATALAEYLDQNSTPEVQAYVSARLAERAAAAGLGGLAPLPWPLARLAYLATLGIAPAPPVLAETVTREGNPEAARALAVYLRALSLVIPQDSMRPGLPLNAGTWNQRLAWLGAAALFQKFGLPPPPFIDNWWERFDGANEPWNAFFAELVDAGYSVVSLVSSGYDRGSIGYRMIHSIGRREPLGATRLYAVDGDQNEVWTLFYRLAQGPESFEELVDDIVRFVPPGVFRNFALYAVFHYKVLARLSFTGIYPDDWLDFEAMSRGLAALPAGEREAALAALRRIAPHLAHDEKIEDLHAATIAHSFGRRIPFVSPITYQRQMAGFPPPETAVVGGLPSQLSLFVPLLAVSSLESVLAGPASFDEKARAVFEFFPHPSNVRDEFLDRLLARPGLGAGQVESMLSAYHVPFRRDKKALAGLSLARQENPGAFGSFEDELAQVRRFFPEPSLMRDEILTRLINEKAQDPRRLREAEALLLRFANNLRSRETARAVAAEDLFKEYLQREEAGDKAAFVLWLFGLAEKPDVVKIFEMRIGVRIDDPGRFLAAQNAGPYQGIGLKAQEDFIRPFLYGATGILENASARDAFLQSLFEAASAGMTLSDAERALHLYIFQTVMEEADGYRRENMVLALLRGLQEGAENAGPPDSSRGLRLFLEAAGMVGIKLGQQLEIEGLKDRAAPIYRGLVFDTIAKIFGDFDAVFASVGEAVGTASVKVVYKARLRNGKVKALKMKRPDAEKRIEEDLAFLERVLTKLRPRLAAEGIAVPDGLVDQIRAVLYRELDFDLEARNQRRAFDAQAARKRARTLFSRLTNFLLRKPAVNIRVVDPDETEVHDNVLMLEEFVDGVPLSDEAGLAALGIDPNPVKEAVAEELVEEILIDGHYHRDLHGGNVLVDVRGNATLIDHGSDDALSADGQAALRAFLLALGARDPPAAVAALRRLIGPEVDRVADDIAQDLLREDAPVAAFMSVLSRVQNAGGTIPDEVWSVYLALGKAGGFFDGLPWTARLRIGLVLLRGEPLMAVLRRVAQGIAESRGEVRGGVWKWLMDAATKFPGVTPRRYVLYVAPWLEYALAVAAAAWVRSFWTGDFNLLAPEVLVLAWGLFLIGALLDFVAGAIFPGLRPSYWAHARRNFIWHIALAVPGYVLLSTAPVVAIPWLALALAYVHYLMNQELLRGEGRADASSKKKRRGPSRRDFLWGLGVGFGAASLLGVEGALRGVLAQDKEPAKPTPGPVFAPRRGDDPPTPKPKMNSLAVVPDIPPSAARQSNRVTYYNPVLGPPSTDDENWARMNSRENTWENPLEPLVYDYSGSKTYVSWIPALFVLFDEGDQNGTLEFYNYTEGFAAGASYELGGTSNVYLKEEDVPEANRGGGGYRHLRARVRDVGGMEWSDIGYYRVPKDAFYNDVQPLLEESLAARAAAVAARKAGNGLLADAKEAEAAAKEKAAAKAAFRLAWKFRDTQEHPTTPNHLPSEILLPGRGASLPAQTGFIAGLLGRLAVNRARGALEEALTVHAARLKDFGAAPAAAPALDPDVLLERAALRLALTSPRAAAEAAASLVSEIQRLPAGGAAAIALQGRALDYMTPDELALLIAMADDLEQRTRAVDRAENPEEKLRAAAELGRVWGLLFGRLSRGAGENLWTEDAFLLPSAALAALGVSSADARAAFHAWHAWGAAFAARASVGSLRALSRPTKQGAKVVLPVVQLVAGPDGAPDVAPLLRMIEAVDPAVAPVVLATADDPAAVEAALVAALGAVPAGVRFLQTDDLLKDGKTGLYSLGLLIEAAGPMMPAGIDLMADLQLGRLQIKILPDNAARWLRDVDLGEKADDAVLLLQAFGGMALEAPLQKIGDDLRKDLFIGQMA